MTLIEQYVAAYNDGDVDRVMSLAAEDCRYYGPTTGETDRATNEAQMRRLLADSPDRRLEILAAAVGDGCELAECELRASNGPIHILGAVVFRVSDGQITSQRWYYAPPSGGFFATGES